VRGAAEPRSPTVFADYRDHRDLILNDIDRVTAVLHRLREEGIRVAIDDFGAPVAASMIAQLTGAR
jgi:predicted signal transduction protein with EAL and GGDEF domain